MAASVVILLGMMMMVWPCIQEVPDLDLSHCLREAFAKPTQEPLPEDMQVLAGEVGRKLRLVRAVDRG